MKYKKIILFLFENISFFIFALWVVFFIKYFLFTPFTVVWQSMYPNIKNWDILLVEKITPFFKKNYERWQIVIVAPPWKDIDFIKRIIWLPWEIVKLIDWKVYICKSESDCFLYKEEYLPENTKTYPKCWIDVFYIDKDSYFVLWDNRENSTDSRCCFGIWCYSWVLYTVKKENIVWIPILRFSQWKFYIMK